MNAPSTPSGPALPTARGRFAPSPTGDLHAGSLLAALGSWLFARSAAGGWLVRIEDVDRPREVPGAAARQLETLAACGLVADGPVIRQSERGAVYRGALDRLLAQGDAFTCHCSRADLAATGGVHARCVARRERPDPAVRFRVPPGTRIGFHDQVQGRYEQDLSRTVGDFVLLRADGCWAYQLAVVVDDAAQGITGVVRGADLIDSTPRQILLQRALGLPTPTYAHLPLLLGRDGRKLSKSDADLPVDPADPLPALAVAWRHLGQRPLELPRGTAPADFLHAAMAGFDPRRIPRTLPFPGA
ncbi:tRNA glutamyl-Q(34) synthetase GluQRS [Lysobacter sp. GX 14042]|uniref:tRNA glutamyl-Q(34) synthetase GluQRS n=1 Tax=Lysobacter sp. GX 14042 TaxID=2907155 RepID=UPI001F417600|nr:tRNA glutamyl-Q(34) synthetase GluQRS [Lysobacter sp. GX 14042]MCE7032809.1 tRNA glutamyl-Q(34) synthetase GluQRS [Lysobacter sp. GX 14042]